MSARRVARFAFAGMLFVGTFMSSPSKAGIGVMPGEEAPPLEVSEWIRGDAVPKYEPGHVYLVDLWATWCVPCLSSMPSMKRLEDAHPNDLTVIAMNVWELQPESIPAFLKAHGDSMPMRVALDSVPDGKEGNEGLVALALLGDGEHISIPRTYLIDGAGRIAWIGNPLEVDEPLSQVLSKSWDSASFAEQYSREMSEELKYRDLFAPVETAVQAKDWEKAILASEAVAAADTAFGDRIANQGFAYVAMQILRQEPPSSEELGLAWRATDRAIDLKRTPDWRLYLLAARVARAAGDSDSAARYLDAGMQAAPPEEQDRFLEAKKSLK